MPFISVREALELPELQSLEVLAGERGLDREIKEVSVLEVPDPVSWLKGGELILTAFYGLRGDNRAQVHLMKRLAPTAAAVCYNPGPGIPFAQGILEVADELALPLLRMPGDMPYAKVITAVLQAILNRQAYLLGRSNEISSMMIRAILNGAEAKEIVTTLARLVKNPVALLDTSLNLVAEDPYYDGGREFLEEGFPLLLDLDIFRKGKQPGEFPVYAALTIRNQELRVGIQAVMIKSSVYGYLTVWEILKRFDEVDSYAIAHASTAVALDFIRSMSLAEQRQKMISSICEDLLSGNFATDDTIIKQGEVLDLDISRLNVVLVVQVETLDGSILKRLPVESDDLVSEVRKLAVSLCPDCLVSGRNGEIVIALGAGQVPDRKKAVLSLAGEVRGVCQNLLGKVKVLVGIGGFARSLEHLTQSYSQARAAINIAKCLSNKRTEISFDDLGIYRLLWGIPRTPDVHQYVEMVLPGAEKCAESLLATLEMYIECQKSLAGASKRLYVHPNTVKYRIKKAKELWGEDILLNQNCTDTLIALKLKRFLNHNPSG